MRVLEIKKVENLFLEKGMTPEVSSLVQDVINHLESELDALVGIKSPTDLQQLDIMSTSKLLKRFKSFK